MIESFGVPENDIARWAGLTSAAFSLSQGFTGLAWGAASDKFGRKPMILIGLFNTMITMLIWGFSTNLPMAITARTLAGLGNGNVGILRTTVAELCPWKELQPRAFSVMPLVYTIGAVFGPTLGGALSNPLHVDPKKPRGTKLLEKYPYCLPNIVACTFFLIGIVTGWLFLKESLEAKKHERDYGLIIGAKITAWVRKTFRIPKKPKKHPEREPLLGNKKVAGDEEAQESGTPEIVAIKNPPKLKDVLTYQTTLNLVVYTLLALYILAYDQVRNDLAPLDVFANRVTASPGVHAPPAAINRQSQCFTTVEVCRRFRYRLKTYWRNIHLFRSVVYPLPVSALSTDSSPSWRSPVSSYLIPNLSCRVLHHAFRHPDSRPNHKGDRHDCTPDD
jgi:MFS family permease